MMVSSTNSDSRRRQHQILEKERRQLGSSAKSRFLVYRDGVLSHRALASLGLERDLFVAVSLEEP
jgi:hypothetical protein